jgi:putative ABC transport system permease protein
MIFEIEGVVEDFHQFSMHRKVAPMMFLIPNERSDYVEMVASLNGSNYKDIITLMEQRWKEIIPNTPFEHTLLSDNIRIQYEDDRRVHSIITTFTLIAIFISCLGLYGLSIYVAERRVKEIGIRKVLGATAVGIVGMLSKDFVKLVAIAFIIAIPIGYYTMTKWLEGFEYKVALDISVFLLSGALSFLLAWVTIGFESIRAAINNPVESLRIE